MDNEKKPYSGQPASPQYVIARCGEEGLQPLRISLKAGGEKVLPVFSSERLARGFLQVNDPGTEWHVRELYNGELASLLFGIWRDAGWILPNPLPEPLMAEDVLLNLADRGSFVSFLLNTRR